MDQTISLLDEQLLELRRAQARTGFRVRLLDKVEDVPSVGMLRVLRSVERAEANGCRPSIQHVARDIEVEHSTASRAVNEAVQRGLIDRRPAGHDKRQILLSLTLNGRAAANRASHNRREMVSEAVLDWQPEQVEEFTEMLASFVEALSRIGREQGGSDG